MIYVDDGYRLQLLNDAAETRVQQLERMLAEQERHQTFIAFGWFILGALVMGLPSVAAAVYSCGVSGW